jgi:hypothetical protein
MSQGPETKGPQKAMYPFQKQTLLYLRTKKKQKKKKKRSYISQPLTRMYMGTHAVATLSPLYEVEATT